MNLKRVIMKNGIPDICCIGHITHDRIVTPAHTVEMPGGTSFYFAHALGCLDPHCCRLVTAVGESELEAVEDIRRRGIDVKVLPSAQSVCFENIYGANSDERTQRVSAKADPFTVEGLKDVDARFFHLGTLLADDFSLDVIELLAGKGVLSVDAQGYLREVRGEDVVAVDWPGKVEALQHVHMLKANEMEMAVLTGHTDVRQAARQLAAWGVKEVLLTLGSMGSLIYADGRFHEIPAYRAENVVDATGCGDTYMAGYLYMRDRGASPLEAGRFAAAMCTIKLGASGPFAASEGDVLDVMRGATC